MPLESVGNLDHLDRKPSVEPDQVVDSRPDALFRAPTERPYSQMEPVASTSRVTLESYANGNGAAARARQDNQDDDDLLFASDTDVEVEPLAALGHDDDDEDDDDSSDEEPLRAAQHRQGYARQMEAVHGLNPGDHVLPDEEFGSKTVAEIYAMLKANVINLTPDYQRDVVWPEAQAAGLIELLLRNMHVPEILFNTYNPVPEDPWYTVIRKSSVIEPRGDEALPSGFDKAYKASEVEDDDELAAAVERGDFVAREVWNCADGKQRMTSIKRFMRGEFSITSNDGSRYTFDKLPAQARKLFEQKRLRYGVYRDLSDAQEREIFRRVQLGKQLDKGEIMRAIDSEYAEWVSELQDMLFPTKDRDLAKSLKPRIVSGKRSLPLKAAYTMSRNLICGIDEMKVESDTVRTRNMENFPRPGRAEQLRVKSALTRFLELTLVPPLKGEDKWPTGKSTEKLREHNVPVPHRVWRLRPRDVAAHADKKVDAIALAPVELNILPTVIEHFRDLGDGDLLEVVQLLRVHLHGMFPGEMKDNTKLYNAVKDWVHEFDPASLKHKYKDDGSLRKAGESSTPIDSRPLKRKLPREGPEDTPTSASKRSALGSSHSSERFINGSSSVQNGTQGGDARPKKHNEHVEMPKRPTSGGESAARRPAESDPSGYSSQRRERSQSRDAHYGAPAPVARPRQQPPPPPLPAKPPPIPGGLSAKEARFSRLTGTGPPVPQNGGARAGQHQPNSAGSLSRNNLSQMGSFKRPTGPFDERGRPLKEQPAVAQNSLYASENDASAAFTDTADNEMEAILRSRQASGGGAYEPSTWSTYGITNDGGIGGPPGYAPPVPDYRDAEMRALLSRRDSRPPEPDPRRCSNGGGSGGSSSGGAYPPRSGGSDAARSRPSDNGWGSRAGGSNADGDRHRDGDRRDPGYDQRPYEQSVRPSSTDPRRRY